MQILLVLSMLMASMMYEIVSAQTDEQECGRTSFSGPNGEVTFPDFPLSYPHNLSCVYFIEVGRNNSVKINFHAIFDLDETSMDSDNCLDDWIMISCNESTADTKQISNKKYCGVIFMVSSLRIFNCPVVKVEFFADESFSRGLFSFYYIVFGEACGNTSFTGPYGVINSPHFSLPNPQRLDCLYSIHVDRTKTVLLYSLSFDLPGVSRHPSLDECPFDWITIGCVLNGSLSEHPLLDRKYCGQRQTPLILRYSNCDSLIINFLTDASNTTGGFQIQYTVTPSGNLDCGKTLFSGPNGVIISPNYLLQYPHNLTCNYSIDVGRNNSVVLKFVSFDLEKPPVVGYCVHDWLTITCNETTESTANNYRKFCGNIQWKFPLRFLDCPSLMIKFSGGPSHTSSTGFVIEYTVVENSSFTRYNNSELDCGDTLFTSSSGVISLPRNPTEYLATVNCTYIISRNKTNTILLNIHSELPTQMLQLLQSFQDCKRENITIGCLSEGGTELNPNKTHVFCGGEIPTSYLPLRQLMFADCRTLMLSVRSVNYDYREIFLIPYLAHDQKRECGRTSFSSPHDVIIVPLLPWPYWKTFNCLFIIDGGHAKSLVLDFGYLPIRSNNVWDSCCNNPWMTITCILNGTSMAHAFEDRTVCAHHHTVLIFSDCDTAILSFSNDHTTSGLAFFFQYIMADYDEECGNTTFTGPTGVITSPRFPLSYPHNLNCMYSIVGGPENVISLSFLAFHIEGLSNTPSIDRCYHEWLTIHCLSDQSTTAGISSDRKYCGFKPTPLIFTLSSCDVVVLNLVTHPSKSHSGFTLQYTVRQIDSLCGVRFHDRPSGVISIPWNYTNVGENFVCSYVINATEPSSILLAISSISIQSLVGGDCQRDWLQVACIDGQPAQSYNVTHGSCDYLNWSTQITFSSCAAVTLVFHRDDTASRKTFRIEYTITRYGDLIVDTPSSLSGKTGHSVAISVTVILVVVIAIVVAALFLYRRHRTKHRSEMLLHAKEEETDQLDLENDAAEAASCSEDQDTSKYVPLRPIIHHEDSASSENLTQVSEEMQPILLDESCLSSQKPRPS